MNAAALHNDFPKPYPFSALIGQDALQQTLILAAIDPGIGGVLVSGPRGTAKSTAARALAELFSEGRFVTLPLGATEERLVGTLDLDEVLRGGAVRFSPGLLAQAHGGVLYVDEVNLLGDALVDALLDAAASGVNVVERDGVSHRHEARFVLIGTMNPEEGELRPQLLDRFGMMVELANCFDPLVRQRIVKARLAFDADPEAFRAACADEQRALAGRIEQARAALPRYVFGDDVHAHVSARCIEAAVDGLRADLVMLRAARALAAFEGAEAITTEHVDRVADAVLRHRRHEQPQPAPAPAPEHAPSRPTDDAGEPHSSAARGASSADAASGERSREHEGDDWGYLPPEPVDIADIKRVVPLTAKKTLSHRKGTTARASSGFRWQQGADSPARRAPVSARIARVARIAWVPTLVRKRELPLRAEHLRFAALASRTRVLHCFLLDCSASMLKDDGLKTAKGLLLAAFDRAAVQREEAALICFGGTRAELRFGPAVPRWWNERWLRPIGAGGGTPFVRGVAAAVQLIERARRRRPQLQCVLWIFTDGRSNEQPARPMSADRIVFVDCERSRLRLDRCRALAGAWGGEYLRADEMMAEPSDAR